MKSPDCATPIAAQGVAKLPVGPTKSVAEKPTSDRSRKTRKIGGMNVETV